MAKDLPASAENDIKILKDLIITNAKGKALNVRLATEDLEFDFKDSISWGLDVFDVFLGGGLYPARTYEVSGPESAGKSTFLDTVGASYQRSNGLLVRVESESTWDKQRAKLIGVDPSKCLVIRPESLEEGIDLVSITVRKVKEQLPNTPILIIWDTITGASTKAEIEKFNHPDDPKYKDGQQAEARLIRQFLDNVTPLMTSGRMTLMLSSQVYGDRDPGAEYRPTEGWVIKGGQGPAHYASVRLFFLRGEAITDNPSDPKKGIVLGYKTRIKLIKNKQSPWVQTFHARLHNELGFDNAGTTMDFLKQYGLIGMTANGWVKYSLGGQERSFLNSRVKEHFEKYPDAQDYFKWIMLNFAVNKFKTLDLRLGGLVPQYAEKYGTPNLPEAVVREELSE